VRTTRFAWLALRGRGCPPAWKLTRASSSEARDADIDIEAHLAACASCAAEYEAHRALVAAARTFAAPAGMSNESRAAIAARLLAAPPETRRPRRTAPGRGAIVFTAAAAVALAIGGVATLHRRGGREPPATASRTAASSTRPSRASIRAIGNARFSRAQPPPDEIVRLDDGRIELDVIPLAVGERFRVITGDGEVEVRGTSFEVLAAGRSLRSVSVSRGRVEVRAGGGLAVLDPGDRWEQAAPAAPAPAAAEAAPPAAPARRAPSFRPRATQPASAAESALFDRGWSALRAGNAGEAAATFAALEGSAKGRAIEEDALYWRAVSVVRTKDSASAGLLFREFLRRFPLSSRRGEAAVALGWILLDAGNVSEARQAFEQASADPASGVRDSAAEGIRRTSRR
jgi:TolA-binding protein